MTICCLLFSDPSPNKLYNLSLHDALPIYSEEILALDLAAGEMKMGNNITHWSTEGFFGRFSYHYKEKYFFEFNGRYDAHSKYPKNIRWAFFPSYSAAWNISNEPFWNIELINNLKLRGSYTSSGDPGLGNYLYISSLAVDVGARDVILGGEKPNMVFSPSLVSNNITWAKPKTIDIGTDIFLLNYRLELTYDWYQRTIYDQPGPVEPLPSVLGAEAPRINNAVSETRGWELSIGWRDDLSIAGNELNYFVRFNISDYIGYVVKYQNNITGSRDGWTPGQIFGKNYAYHSAGIAQTISDYNVNVTQGNAWYYPGDLMMKDLNGDGKIDDGEGGYWFSMGDLVSNGYNYPRYRYGISVGGAWKGFDLSILFSGVGAWKIYANSPWLFGATDQWNGGWFKEHENLGAWTPENNDAFFPRHAFNQKNTDRANDHYTVNLANLNIQNFRIGYSLSSNFIKYLGIDKFNIYVSIENAGYLFYKSWIKYDPEIIDAHNGQGYPPQR